MIDGLWNGLQKICSTMSVGDYLTVVSFVVLCFDKWDAFW